MQEEKHQNRETAETDGWIREKVRGKVHVEGEDRVREGRE